MEGAKEARTSGPVPAGAQWVTQPLFQTRDGTEARRPAVVSAAVHVPRKILERAWTGPSHSAGRGERPGEPSGARAPPGTREWTCGW